MGKSAFVEMDIQHIKKYVSVGIKELKWRLFKNMLYINSDHFNKFEFEKGTFIMTYVKEKLSIGE